MLLLSARETGRPRCPSDSRPIYLYIHVYFSLFSHSNPLQSSPFLVTNIKRGKILIRNVEKRQGNQAAGGGEKGVVSLSSLLSKWIFLHALEQTEAENRRGKAKKQKQSQGLQARGRGRGPARGGRAESEVGRPGSEAQSKPPRSGLQARAARAANTCSGGLRAALLARSRRVARGPGCCLHAPAAGQLPPPRSGRWLGKRK